MAFSETLETGADWTDAEVIVILLHGHGQTPEDMRRFAVAIDRPTVRYLLPGADSWFPKGILETFDANGEALGHSLSHLGAIVESLRARKIALEQIVLGGFAQGACVVAEYLIRNPKGYGGALLLTGGLVDVAAIGRRPGSGLLGVPIYVSGSETEAVIPVERTRGAIKTLQAGGALIRSNVFKDRSPGISGDELLAVGTLLDDVMKAARLTV